MRKSFLVLYICLLLVLAAGCAPLPRAEPVAPRNTLTLNEPFDVVWTKLIEYLSSTQIQIKTIDKPSGFVDTEFMILSGQVLADYAWTGQRLPSLLHDKGRIKANIFIKKIGESRTSVTINTLVNVFETYPAPGRWLPARSTGMYEERTLSVLR